ncbi:hypothetical protein EP7_002621 [Isosphaeraceae bacterium EP7]
MAKAPRKSIVKPTILTVERKIYFYRAILGKNEDLSPIAFDPSPVLEIVDRLTFDPPQRYQISIDGTETLCIVDRNTYPHRIRLCNVRRSDFPHEEERGVFAPLSIAAGKGLVEPVHVVFFADNIVGCEFNFYGPRIGKLRTYLATKGGEFCREITFAALLRKNASMDLNRLSSLRTFQLKIHSSFAESVKKADERLGSAFVQVREVGEAETIEICLKPATRSVLQKLSSSLLESARKLTRMPDIREQAKIFKVAGEDEETGKQFVIDLLSDQLIAKKKILKSDPKSRAVDSESAYQAIEEAYSELRGELVKMSGLSV